MPRESTVSLPVLEPDDFYPPPPVAGTNAAGVTFASAFELLQFAEEQISRGAHELSLRVSDAAAALKMADLRLSHQQAKAARLMSCGGDPAAVNEILQERWEDAMLREAFAKCGDWKDLAAKGATDEQIATRLKKWPQYSLGCVQDFGWYQRDWDGRIAGFKFWVSAQAHFGPKLFKLEGKEVVAAARRLFKIKLPGKNSNKPTPSKQAGRKANSGTSPGGTKANASRSPSGAKAKPPGQPAPSKPKPKRQTFNQWRAAVCAVLRRNGEELPQQDSQGHTETLKAWYDNWDTAPRAAEKWLALWKKQPAAPPKPEAKSEPKPADPTTLLTMEELGLSQQELDEAFDNRRLKASATLARVVTTAKPINACSWYAMLGAASTGGPYVLHPLVPRGRWVGDPITMGTALKGGRTIHNAKLEGVQVKADGVEYVLGSHAGRLLVANPKDAETEGGAS